MAAVLQLDGNAAGAVDAVTKVSTAAQGLKGHFEEAGQAASGFGSTVASSLESMAGYFAAIAGPGALLSMAVAGIKEMNEELTKAGELSSHFTTLAQLGPGALATARGLISAGVPEDKVAGIAAAMRAAPEADRAFIERAAPTNIFGNIPGMELAARAWEAAYPSETLPGLLGKAGAAFGPTGLTPEEGLQQVQGLAAGFGAAGIGESAAMALSSGMTTVMGGDAGKATTFLRSMLGKGVFQDMPADVRADPGRMLDYIGALGGDDEGLAKLAGGRGIITAKALIGARGMVEERFRATEVAGESDAFGMLDTAASNEGLAAAQAERARAGADRVREESRGVLRTQYMTHAYREAEESTRGMAPLTGGAARGLRHAGAYLETLGPDYEMKTILDNIERNTRGGPQPSGRAE